MEILEWITTGLIVIIVGGIGASKFTSKDDIIEQAKRLGYYNIRRQIGMAEIAGALGVLIGAAVTDLEWLGMAAAAGIIAMMIGAIGYHLRAGDKFENLPAVVVIVLSVLYLVAINAS